MGVEHLGLRLAAIAALAIPPFRAVAIDDMAGRTRDSDLCPADADEGTFPLLVAEGGGALENDLVSKVLSAK